MLMKDFYNKVFLLYVYKFDVFLLFLLYNYCIFCNIFLDKDVYYYRFLSMVFDMEGCELIYCCDIVCYSCVYIVVWLYMV